MRSCGGIGRHAGLRYQCASMRVRVPPGAPIGIQHKHSIPMLRIRARTANLAHYAGVVELADTLDLGSSAARCKGSSPFARTIFKAHTANLLLEECEFKSHKPRLGFWRNGLRD